MCLDSNSHVKSRTESRKKFGLVSKCLYFQNYKLIQFRFVQELFQIKIQFFRIFWIFQPVVLSDTNEV